MKLTIVTINHNNVDGLRRTLSSVFDQSERAFEYIVIDGGSVDGSRELLAGSQGIDIWVSERDSGIYDAMNKGINKASGDYLLFINSGDCLFASDTISKALPYLDGTAIVYGNLKLAIEPSHLIDGFMPNMIDLRQMMVDTLWHPVSFIKRGLFLTHGSYDVTYKICGDYEFFFNVLIDKKVSQRHIDEFVAIFDLMGMSSMPENRDLLVEEKHRAQRKWLSQYEIDRFWRAERRRRVLRRGRRFVVRAISRPNAFTMNHDGLR